MCFRMNNQIKAFHIHPLIFDNNTLLKLNKSLSIISDFVSVWNPSVVIFDLYPGQHDLDWTT